MPKDTRRDWNAGQIRVPEREPMLSTSMVSSILRWRAIVHRCAKGERGGKREILILNPFTSARGCMHQRPVLFTLIPAHLLSLSLDRSIARNNHAILLLI